MKQKNLTSDKEVDRRLGYLEQIETGDCFFFDHTTNRERFIKETIESVMSDESLTNVVLYFKLTLKDRTARSVSRQVGRRLEHKGSKVIIDSIYVPPELFDLLLIEYNATPHERGIAVQHLIDKLNTLRLLFNKDSEFASYLEENLQANRKEAEYLAVPREPAYHFGFDGDWELSLLETQVHTKRVKELIESYEKSK